MTPRFHPPTSLRTVQSPGQPGERPAALFCSLQTTEERRREAAVGGCARRSCPSHRTRKRKQAKTGWAGLRGALQPRGLDSGDLPASPSLKEPQFPRGKNGILSLILHPVCLVYNQWVLHAASRPIREHPAIPGALLTLGISAQPPKDSLSLLTIFPQPRREHTSSCFSSSLFLGLNLTLIIT